MGTCNVSTVGPAARRADSKCLCVEKMIHRTMGLNTQLVPRASAKARSRCRKSAYCRMKSARPTPTHNRNDRSVMSSAAAGTSENSTSMSESPSNCCQRSPRMTTNRRELPISVAAFWIATASAVSVLRQVARIRKAGTAAGEKSTDPDIAAMAAGWMLPRMGAGSNTNLVARVKYAGVVVGTIGCAEPADSSAFRRESRVSRCKSAPV